MKKILELLNDLSFLLDIINTVLGIILIILIVLILQHPYSNFMFTAAFIVGGSMNILNGVKLLKDPKKKSIGLSFLLMGIIIIFIGITVVNFIHA